MTLAELIVFVRGRASTERAKQRQRLDLAGVWRSGTQREWREGKKLAERMGGRPLPVSSAETADGREQNAVIDERIAAHHELEAGRYDEVAATVERLAQENAQLRTLAERRRVALRQAEWSGALLGGQGSCPVCGRQQERGHAQGCGLAAALKETNG